MNSTRGRRPGATATREAIAAAARRSFGELGYDRTTIRGIAHSAGVDSSLVLHFHGSKRQLFAAVMGPPPGVAGALGRALPGDPSTAGERLAAAVVDLLEDEDVRTRVTGMVRAAASEPSAAALVRELLTREVYGPFAAVLDRPDAELRATLVGAHIVGIVMARYVVGLEPLASLGRGALAAVLAPVLQRFLTEPLVHKLGR